MFNPAAQSSVNPVAMRPPFPYAAVAPLPPPPFGVPVRVVWAHNVDAEMHVLQDFARRARYVAFVVHYPGVVHGAAGQQDHNKLAAEKRYAIIKANVDALKPLQVGIAVGTDDGRCLAWEFNLRGFDRETDPHAARSVEYLAERGMDFDAHRLHGIPMATLTAWFHHCRLLRRRGLPWIAYAGAYHVAYLLKVITGGKLLPGDIAGFLGVVQQFLGVDVYDVARMARDCPSLPVGLERVAYMLRLAPPLGSPQLAGAGGVLALQAFVTLKFGVFGGDVNRYRGLLHGLQIT
ncbi:probable CCR4-associated factor 1 homolog 11 [Phragmites australis]|uniref:probable CCR4-associated factor 1 homolog 11 n=1 Tax=Phragmites australis TaxID=29695 RepID=UPI002D780037|nr:probable CCR4-associated factor 1 homolog 11 [Phragmites australis]